jgi:hypothetical protein
MYQFKGYCYASQNELFTTIASDPLFIDPTTSQSTNFASLGNGQVRLSRGTDNLVYSAPACSVVGPTSSYFGLTIPDAVDLGWSCVLILVTAYVISIMRKAL